MQITTFKAERVGDGLFAGNFCKKNIFRVKKNRKIYGKNGGRAWCVPECGQSMLPGSCYRALLWPFDTQRVGL